MTDEAGGFYSAEDADSVPLEHGWTCRTRTKIEGAFYVWTADEIRALLGDDARGLRAPLRRRCPTATRRSIRSSEFANKNLLYTAQSIADIARELSMEPTAVAESLLRSRVSAVRRARRRGRGRSSTTRC